jgi:hypothetical protein
MARIAVTGGSGQAGRFVIPDLFAWLVRAFAWRSLL